MKIFADDTKVYNTIENNEDVVSLQKAIDEMFQWTEKWLLRFNKEKCKVLHLGSKNLKHDYYIGEGNDRILLEKSEVEKDLGIHVDQNLDFKRHIKNTVKKGNYACYKILKNFTYRDQNILIPLFKSLVRPILEYGNAVWNNGIKKFMNKIENVQRKLTKHVKNMHLMTYEERLRKLKLPSLEFRQMRGDLIQVYKIANGIYDPLSTNSIFDFSNNSRLRGHRFKINKQQTNKSKYLKFFSNRAVTKWNNLPSEIVEAKSLNVFKNKLDCFYKDTMYKVNIDYF